MKIVLIGLGNIGSPLAGHVARLAECTELVLVDRDRYEAKNVQSQGVMPADAGQPKAEAQTRRVREARPEIEVQAVAGDIEDVPLGLLRADAVLTAVDSRRARQIVSERLIWMGTPLWIDSGVDADRGLVRVSVFAPADVQDSCIQCSWSDEDYTAIEARYSCLEGDGPAPTGASSMLGAMAAALQSMELERALTKGARKGASQLIAGCAELNGRRWALSRNARCRFNHRRLPIEAVGASAGKSSLASLLRLGEAGSNWSLAVPGQRFVRKICCRHCGVVRDPLVLEAALLFHKPPCERCSKPLEPRTLQTEDRLDADGLPGDSLEQPLSALGLRPLEVVEINNGCGQSRFVELGGN
jgi:molybdopterin/thiamine biosynthesis adenylyltransferase